MPTEKQDPSQNPNFAYYLSNSDLNAMKLVSIEIEGEGKCFSDWRRSMMITLSARNKLCFVDGSLNQPAVNYANYMIWIRCNNLVISWMLASLEPSIARSVLYLKTPRATWLELEERYCREFGPQLFSVQQKLSELTQGDDEAVASFFTKIKLLWDQLDDWSHHLFVFKLEEQQKEDLEVNTKNNLFCDHCKMRNAGNSMVIRKISRAKEKE
ncbi:uncharacterized protein [Spinacia oleracea]|uniref:Retrotransposon Copia-like N-terminal domain-containing protein n=1 Tax=Spinacia oleracea TaxID=3562 RepID=A0ABM3QZ60_SPIOL|nr:uncharacterized protein LOC130463521 [Spinacia oleracea]